MKGGGRITSQNDCVILIPSILLKMERYMSGNFRGHQHTMSSVRLNFRGKVLDL